MEVVYKLWEGSWEDDAVVRDRENGIFARPDKVHKIHHHVTVWMRSISVNLRHREHRFDIRPALPPEDVNLQENMRNLCSCAAQSEPASSIADIPRRAARNGCDAAEVLMFAGITVFVGCTEQEAEARVKYDEYHDYENPEGVFALLSGWTGI